MTAEAARDETSNSRGGRYTVSRASSGLPTMRDIAAGLRTGARLHAPPLRAICYVDADTAAAGSLSMDDYLIEFAD